MDVQSSEGDHTSGMFTTERIYCSIFRKVVDSFSQNKVKCSRVNGLKSILIKQFDNYFAPTFSVHLVLSTRYKIDIDAVFRHFMN